MRKFFVEQNQIENKHIVVLGDDVNHIKNVLRLGIGEEIDVSVIGENKSYRCKIESLEQDKINLTIIEELEVKEEKVILDIYQGLPKFDKFELIIQKCVELGANSFIPVAMNRSIAKFPNKKDEDKKLERWQKIAEVAAKQSKRNSVPKVEHIVKLDDVLKKKDEYDLMLLAYENEENLYIKEALKNIDKKNKYKIAIIIGPEGGLSPEEVEKVKKEDVKVVSLGDRILRTETAPIMMASIIMYELEN